ncbi:MAG: hypothetical protein JKY51_01830 [Opitutaceae bacterium]|nr:hypothetical protein [Opitutaceae bacterium]
MKTEITQEIWNQISNYVSGLDWAYILTFIIIAYGINHYWVKDKIKKTTKVKSKTRYRTVIVGVLYAVALYFVRGYNLEKIECLFQSLVFALVFHQLIIDGVMNFIAKRMLPKNVGKHIACTNDIKRNLNGQM